MSRKTERNKLHLSSRERSRLKSMSDRRDNFLREARIAKVLLLYADETPITKIQQLVNVSRPTIYKYIDRALGAGGQGELVTTVMTHGATSSESH